MGQFVEQISKALTPEMKNWIIPGFDEYNCTSFNVTSSRGPSVSQFLNHLAKYQLVLLILAGFLTLLTSVFSLVEGWYVYMNISIENRRNKLYFLITLFPISMILCFIGMLMPRAASLATSGGMLYFLLCLFVLVSLIRHLKNGRNELSNELLLAGKNINFQSPPICCFFPCLPEARPTIRNLRILEFIVLQAPIVRAIVLFIEATITVEIQRDAAYEIQLCEFATFGSILLAVFGVHTMARLVADKLTVFGFMWIFRIVDIALLFFSAQHPTIFQNILLRFNLLGCGPVLTPPENARFLCNFAVICELFLLSILGIFTISPKRNKMFDGYKITDAREDDSESLVETMTNSTADDIVCLNNSHRPNRNCIVTGVEKPLLSDSQTLYGSIQDF